MTGKILYGILAILCIASSASADQPSGLIAHWTFDTADDRAFADLIGSLNGRIESGATTGEGVFGSAATLLGRAVIRIKNNQVFSKLDTFGISAWVRPTELSDYREIFRKEDGNRRILFSFQHGGTILSLGLNVAGAGYKELDARIEPATLKDGRWHHACGTFDGKMMRVYLDGVQIAQMPRTGKIVSGGPADAFIGSSGGGGEFFQGGIDDLRIWNVAPGDDEIRNLYKQGLEAELDKQKKYKQLLEKVYREEDTFAQTMAATRRNLIGQSDAEPLARLIALKLTVTFGDETRQFSQITGSGTAAYLAADEDSWNAPTAERILGLATEYMPLTEQQWARIDPAQRRQWMEVEHLQKRFEKLKAAGDTADPAWIDMILEAGRRITERPVQHEAVAPYIKPYTPQTKDYTPAEAKEILRRDWLHQIEGQPTLGKIAKEIIWTRNLAARIQTTADTKVDLSTELELLEELAGKASQNADADLYYAVRAVKRRIMFADPAVDFDSLLFVDIPFPAGSEWPHETRHRLGYMAVPGGRLMTLKGLSPAGHVKKLMPVEPLHGTFWRPDLSYDAKRVLFSFHPANEKNFHLYEINIDGTDMRQITDGIYDDVDPIYLPDSEHIVFASTRGHNYVRCMPPTNSFSVTRCRLDGRGMYIISRNNEPDYLPAMLDDGRVIYTRWEYTDKPLWRAQSLWTMNPDGTGAATYWGNQSVWPDLLKDARQIPGSERVMFTGSAHHNWFSGCIGIVDTGKGLNFPGGLTKVTSDLEWPESGNGPVDPVESKNYHSSGRYAAYQNPYPLSEDVFLVSANRGGKFVLYLMDVQGNRELIYEGAHNIFHAMPVKPRPKPAILPDAVKWPTMAQRHSPAPGVIYSSNVYHKAPANLKGRAKYLRILTMDAKTYSYWYKRPYASTGPVVSMVSSEGVKRILGTVPIEEDGSVHFEAPAGKALYFQLLDARFTALQTMRSISGVMPGETRGCVGCHEMHSTAPVAKSFGQALKREPSKITPPPWGDESISYFRFVQPVLDKYCGPCHQGDGKARKKLDLTLRGNGLFKEPYPLLLGRPTWGKAYDPPEDPPPGFGIADTILVEAFDQRDPKAYITPEPMTKLSYKSRLVEIASSGRHNDVKVDETSRRRLIAWVDAMGPYRGDEEVRAIADPQFQGIDWLSMRPQIKNAPIVHRPGPIEAGP